MGFTFFLPSCLRTCLTLNLLVFMFDIFNIQCPSSMSILTLNFDSFHISWAPNYALCFPLLFRSYQWYPGKFPAVADNACRVRLRLHHHRVRLLQLAAAVVLLEGDNYDDHRLHHDHHLCHHHVHLLQPAAPVLLLEGGHIAIIIPCLPLAFHQHQHQHYDHYI